jgi:hypothetical protein
MTMPSLLGPCELASLHYTGDSFRTNEQWLTTQELGTGS